MFDRVCTGPRERQIETCRIVADEYAKAGVPFPAPEKFAELDEYDGEAVLRQGVPELVAHKRYIRDLYDAYHEASQPGERHLRFQRLFEAVITIWVNGDLLLEGIEPWDDFSGEGDSRRDPVFGRWFVERAGRHFQLGWTESSDGATRAGAFSGG